MNLPRQRNPTVRTVKNCSCRDNHGPYSDFDDQQSADQHHRTIAEGFGLRIYPNMKHDEAYTPYVDHPQIPSNWGKLKRKIINGEIHQETIEVGVLSGMSSSMDREEEEAVTGGWLSARSASYESPSTGHLV